MELKEFVKAAITELQNDVKALMHNLAKTI